MLIFGLSHVVAVTGRLTGLFNFYQWVGLSVDAISHETPGTVRSLGPQLGQDTELILFETLGYDWDKIGALKESGTIL
jgi:hypothetical protein